MAIIISVETSAPPAKIWSLLVGKEKLMKWLTITKTKPEIGRGEQFEILFKLDRQEDFVLREISASGNSMKSLSRRVGVSIVTSIGWLIFVLLWIGFYWSKFAPGQNIIIIIVSFLVYAAINGVMWTSWALTPHKDNPWQE